MLSVFTSFNTMNEWMKLILIGYFHFHIYLSLKLLRMHSTYFFFRTFIMPYFQEKVFLFLFSKNNAERSFNKKPKMGHCYLSCCLCPLALLVSWQEGLGGLFSYQLFSTYLIVLQKYFWEGVWKKVVTVSFALLHRHWWLIGMHPATPHTPIPKL